MAIIGTLGDIIFSVSERKVKTFNDMKWETSANYATHDRHMQDDLLEFLGTEPGTISFSMHFSVMLGVNPVNELNKVLSAEKSGQVMRLVIGHKVYGRHKWVITKTSKSLERFDKKGNLWIASIDISLKEYAER